MNEFIRQTVPILSLIKCESFQNQFLTTLMEKLIKKYIIILVTNHFLLVN